MPSNATCLECKTTLNMHQCKRCILKKQILQRYSKSTACHKRTIFWISRALNNNSNGTWLNIINTLHEILSIIICTSANGRELIVGRAIVITEDGILYNTDIFPAGGSGTEETKCWTHLKYIVKTNKRAQKKKKRKIDRKIEEIWIPFNRGRTSTFT